MGHKVTYTDKSGKVASVTFGSLALAESYSRTVKGARIESTSTLAPEIAVSRVQDGTAEAQKAATRSYYLGDRKPVSVAPESSESHAEKMAEHFAEARCVGQCMEDAWADWDYSQGGNRGKGHASKSIPLSLEDRDGPEER